MKLLSYMINFTSNNNFEKLPEPVYWKKDVTRDIVLDFVNEICDLKPGNKKKFCVAIKNKFCHSIKQRRGYFLH
jgi:hypothetical protein